MVVAGEQTAGRGRLGRSFFRPGKPGVYFSLVLRPSPETEASLLTTAAAVAVAQAAEGACRAAGRDQMGQRYLYGWKEICGILTEGTYSIEEGRMESAVLGIGVNVSPPAEGFLEELRKKAGTILKTGNNARSRLIARILEIFWEYYENLDAGTFYSEYRRRPASGKRVEILGKGRREPAKVLDIGRDFSLILQKANGEIERLRAGEVEICYGKNREKIRKTHPMRLFAALTAVGAFIKIPVPVVPFTLQFFMHDPGGLAAGRKMGALSVALYIALGLLGIPYICRGWRHWLCLKTQLRLSSGILSGKLFDRVLARRGRGDYGRLLVSGFVGLGRYICWGWRIIISSATMSLLCPSPLAHSLLLLLFDGGPGDILLLFSGSWLAWRLLLVLGRKEMQKKRIQEETT